MNRIGKLLSFWLAFVLCYSQLVASAHFVEHLPHQNHGNEALTPHQALHRAEHTNKSLAGHAAFHADHPTLATRQLVSHPRASTTPTSPEHSERSIADCSIYHFYSGLNGLVHARAEIPCASFDHVMTVAIRATHHQQAVAHYQPIRAPPYFS